MNVKDVVPMPAPELSMQPEIIIARQSELEAYYCEIEKRESPIVGVNSHYGQILIKDFLWRITEEVGEALEAFSKSESMDKVYEELADGLHFVAGLCIITNYKAVFINSWDQIFKGVKVGRTEENRAKYVANFVMRAGILGNTLKLKPWKQTDVMTDEIYFGSCMYDMVCNYLWICMAFGMSHEQLFDFYYRKSEVNLFRIRSKY
jgi:hypothetical protein